MSAYSFWASHGALALPFLPSSYRRSMRLHSFDLYEREDAWLPLRASLFGSVDALLPISADGSRYLRENFGDLIPDGVLEVLRLGTADHGAAPRPAPLSATEPGEPIRVVSCSSVIEIKRVSSILPALEKLAAKRHVEWTHFGSGPLFESLDSASREAEGRLPSLEVNLRGQVANNQVLAHYRNKPVHVFVNVSDAEGVPVSIMEALSFGIPVVATDVGGSGEIVSAELGSGELLAPRPAAQSLADAILSVVTRRDDLTPREVWERYSDARVWASRIADVLEQP